MEYAICYRMFMGIQTLLVNTGPDINTLKRHGTWKSSCVKKQKKILAQEFFSQAQAITTNVIVQKMLV